MKIVIILTTLKQWNPCHQEKENKKKENTLKVKIQTTDWKNISRKYRKYTEFLTINEDKTI